MQHDGAVVEVVHHPLDPVHEHRGMEIYQQPDAHPGETKVAEELGLMNRQHMFNGFNLNNHGIFDKEIQPVAAVQLNTLVNDRKRCLAFKAQTGLRQLIAETFFVRRLQKAGTEDPVDLDTCTENALC
jgi:hypothetical protein